MTKVALDARQVQLMGAFVAAWQQSNHVPFDFDSGGTFSHPCWPPGVAVPDREEVRRLHHLGMLDVDRDAAPTWRVHPSPAARQQFGSAHQQQVADALRDPDRRLAVILEATVQAFEADPGEPLHFAPMDQVEMVRHQHWPIAPDVVHQHDLEQLEDLGLIGVSPRGRDSAFWPTVDGRAAVRDPVGLLERRASNSASEHDASRLRRWAEKLRTGDVAVGVVADTTGAAIRALIGF